VRLRCFIHRLIFNIPTRRAKTRIVIGSSYSVCARKGHLFRLVLRAFFSDYSIFFLSSFYYRLINKRFPGGSTSGTWRRRRRVTDFSGLLFRSFFRCSSRVRLQSSPCPLASIIIQSPIRWKTFRRFAPVMSPWDPFYSGGSGDGHCLNTQWLYVRVHIRCIYTEG